MTEVDLRSQMALSAAGMSVWDSALVDGQLMKGSICWSASGAALLGFPQTAFVQPFADFAGMIHPEDRTSVIDKMQYHVERLENYEVEYRLFRSDGTMRWIRAKAQPLADQHGVATRTLGLIWDVTDMVEKDRLSAERETRAQVTLDCIGDGVITTDAHGNTVFVNREAERLTGWAREIAHGRPIQEVLQLVDDRGGGIDHVAARCMLKREAIGISSHVQLITRDGRRIAVEDSAAPIWHDGATLLGAVVVFRDVTHQRLLAAELSWHATHDVLTGLFNRREFERQVASALHASKQTDAEHTVLYIDLDRFKLVNDTAGHAAGDALLKVLTGMLQEKMRDSDMLARLGGDELGVLLHHCDLEQARLIAEEIRQLIKDFRFVWDANSFEVGASIGLVAINADSRSVSDILSAADEACYMAKAEGRNRIHVYTESDTLLMQRHTEALWVPRLNEALRHNHFRLFVMPIVSLNGEPPPHEEVLLRLANGRDSLTPPGAFIPAAERYHIMPLIDRWVLQAACSYLRNVREGAPPDGAEDGHGAPPGRLSINLSGLSMNDDQLIGFITDQLAAFDIDPAQLCFEITETAAISNLPKAQQLMNTLKALGCRFSLDDFGSGLSSFGYLKSLPVDYIKIDGAFIRDIARNPVHLAMVEAIHKVGRVMGILTVAEYVEDNEALDVLRGLGVNFAQGHAVGAPRELPWQAPVAG